MSAIPVDDMDAGADAMDEDAVTGAGVASFPFSNGSIIFLKYCIGFNWLKTDLDSFCFRSFFCAKYTFDGFCTLFVSLFIFSSWFKNARP